MTAALGNLRSLVARFGREERAVAAVEFALVMPFMLALYFGSMEAAALFTADKRVNSISATVGDLVAQWDPDDGNLSTSTLSDYLSASTGIITPYSPTGLKIVISLVEVKSTGVTKVLWSQANSGATARTANSTFTPLTTTSEMNIISRGGCVVTAEVSYLYKPLFGQVFTTALNLAHTNYFLPRYGSTSPISVGTTTQSATACTS